MTGDNKRMSHNIGTHISFSKEPPFIHVSNEWKIGTKVSFTQVAGKVTSFVQPNVIHIPVQFA